MQTCVAAHLLAFSAGLPPAKAVCKALQEMTGERSRCWCMLVWGMQSLLQCAAGLSLFSWADGGAGGCKVWQEMPTSYNLLNIAEAHAGVAVCSLCCCSAWFCCRTKSGELACLKGMETDDMQSAGCVLCVVCTCSPGLCIACPVAEHDPFDRSNRRLPAGHVCQDIN